MNQHEEKRQFPRIVVNGMVAVGGRIFPLCNLGPGGGALVGKDIWWEEDMPALLSIPHGIHEFVLHRFLRTCYAAPQRGVVGFEFVDANAHQTDIVLSLILDEHSNSPIPLAMSEANGDALQRLLENGHADCTEGAWSAYSVGKTRTIVTVPAETESVGQLES